MQNGNVVTMTGISVGREVREYALMIRCEGADTVVYRAFSDGKEIDLAQLGEACTAIGRDYKRQARDIRADASGAVGA